MHSFSPLTALFVGSSLVQSITAVAIGCTSSARLAGAAQVPYAYNLKPIGASAAAFAQVPFAWDCVVEVYPNGLPGVITALDGATTRGFAIETRQAFTEVTGAYTDYDNGTTVIHTVVTVGALHTIPLPVKFSANVHLTYDLETCEIKKVDAYATVPTSLLGFIVSPPTVG